MRDEMALRRPEFRPGISIRLADGQFWTFPAPSSPERAGEGGASGPGHSQPDSEYDDLIGGVLEAEDEVERLRAELALAIHLLGKNYDLEPADYGRVLEFPPGSPALTALQCDFHALAVAHARKPRCRSQGLPVRWAWSRIFSGSVVRD